MARAGLLRLITKIAQICEPGSFQERACCERGTLLDVSLLILKIKCEFAASSLLALMDCLNIVKLIALLACLTEVRL
jgi:hypothetical protein